MLLSRLEQKTGSRFATEAILCSIVETRKDIVQRKSRAEQSVHFFNSGDRLTATAHIRLISDDYENETDMLQPLQTLAGSGNDSEFVQV